MSMNLLYLLLFVFQSSSSKIVFIPSFLDVSLRKCDGLFSTEHGQITFNKTSSFFIQEIVNSSKAQCQWICAREMDDCLMIEYLRWGCRLYKSDAFEIGGEDKIEFWKCPKPFCVKLPGRCPSYWVGYDGYKGTDDSLIPISTVRNVSVLDCQTLCEKHSLCGSLDFFCYDMLLCSYSRGDCTLLFGYLKPLTKKISNRPNHKSMTLRCCDLEELSYGRIKKTRVVGKDYKNINGQWEIIKYKFQYETNLTRFRKVLYTSFICLDFMICVETCSKEPFCRTPIFVNGPVPICYLELDAQINNFGTSSSIIQRINNSESIIWKWKTDFNEIDKMEIGRKNESCLCFRKGQRLRMKISCGWRYIDIIVNSTLNMYYRGQMNNDSQKNEREIVNLDDGHRLYSMTTDGVLRNDKCERRNCDRYNEVIYNNDFQEYVSRNEWLAAEPKERNFLDLPVGLLIILNTYKPHGRCFSKYLCSKYIRDFQHFHFRNSFSDIAYNFLIGEDGRIYEGRGWNRMGSHTKGYNSKSIGVAFIGWFEVVEPNNKALIALRNLIQYGIQHDYLKSNFKLVSHKDLRGSETPGERLHKILLSWPFMDISQAILCEETPKHVDIKIIIIPISLILPLLVFFTFLFRKRAHNNRPCQKLKMKLKSVDHNIGWFYNNLYKIEFEGFDINKDWVYFCRDNLKKKVILCNCYQQVYALWVFCLLLPEESFFSRLPGLVNTLNCLHTINIYIEKPKVSTDSKYIVFFHLQNDNQKERENICNLFKKDKSCICKRFSVKRIPRSSCERMQNSSLIF